MSYEDPNLVKAYCINCSDDGDYGYICEDCIGNEEEWDAVCREERGDD